MKKTLEDYLHLYVGCEVQYEGIVNGNELGAELKANKHDVFYIPKIEEKRGLKTGVLKKIEYTVNGKFRMCRIGRKGLQSHYTCEKFKPILRPLSDMTEGELQECGNLVYDFSDDTSGLGLNEHKWEDFTLLLCVEQFHWLLSKHFDLFGLIEAGLAIDKTKM